MPELLANWLACGLDRKCEVREAVAALLSLDLFLDPFLLRLLSGRVSTAAADAHLQTAPQHLKHTNRAQQNIIIDDRILIFWVNYPFKRKVYKVKG